MYECQESRDGHLMYCTFSLKIKSTWYLIKHIIYRVATKFSHLFAFLVRLCILDVKMLQRWKWVSWKLNIVSSMKGILISGWVLSSDMIIEWSRATLLLYATMVTWPVSCLLLSGSNIFTVYNEFHKSQRQHYYLHLIFDKIHHH